MKQEKKELSIEEAFAEVFNITCNFLAESTKLSIRFYENKFKRLQREMVYHEDNEPLKIFKKSHTEWETKKKKLNKDLEDTFNILMEEYENIEQSL